MAPRIYLDHAATTPLLPAARAAMADALGFWANPSSPHREGRAARAALEEARTRIKAALGWRHDLIFTSGASESATLALARLARPRPAAVSAVEHPAVLRPRPEAIVLPVDADGLVDRAAIPAGALVAIQQVNSETGVIQPLGEITVPDGLLLVDAAQGAGKLALPEADLIAVSAHKLGGPPGIGALLVRDLALLQPFGAGQERGYRPGTENLPAILGFAAALDQGRAWVEPQRGWRDRLDAVVRASGGVVVCDGAPRSPCIASYRLPGLAAEALLIRLDLAGFAVSAGSACSSGSLHPSHVMTAIGLDERAAREVVRISFGPTTTEAEVEAFAAAWAAIAADGRARAA